MGKRKTNRPLSHYQLWMQRQMLKGYTMAEAVQQWRNWNHSPAHFSAIAPHVARIRALCEYDPDARDDYYVCDWRMTFLH
jgi:hypothetical protein